MKIPWRVRHIAWCVAVPSRQLRISWQTLSIVEKVKFLTLAMIINTIIAFVVIIFALKLLGCVK